MDNHMATEVQGRFTITAVDPGCQESIDLQWEMRRGLDKIYDVRTTDPPPLEQFRLPRSVFLIGWAGQEAVGCGAFTPLNESTAVVKRVFIRPAIRRKGLATLIMAQLERRAAGMGYTRVLLETSDKLPEATALYERLGYQRASCADLPLYDERCVWYEKRL